MPEVNTTAPRSYELVQEVAADQRLRPELRVCLHGRGVWLVQDFVCDAQTTGSGRGWCTGR